MQVAGDQGQHRGEREDDDEAASDLQLEGPGDRADERQQQDRGGGDPPEHLEAHPEKALLVRVGYEHRGHPPQQEAGQPDGTGGGRSLAAPKRTRYPEAAATAAHAASISTVRRTQLPRHERRASVPSPRSVPANRDPPDRDDDDVTARTDPSRTLNKDKAGPTCSFSVEARVRRNRPGVCESTTRKLGVAPHLSEGLVTVVTPLRAMNDLGSLRRHEDGGSSYPYPSPYPDARAMSALGGTMLRITPRILAFTRRRVVAACWTWSFRVLP